MLTDGLSSSADPTSAIATEPSGNTGHTTTDADPSDTSLPIDSDSSMDEAMFTFLFDCNCSVVVKARY